MTCIAQGIKEAGKLCRESGVMSLAMMVNPYSHLGFEPSADQLQRSIKIYLDPRQSAKPRDAQKVIQTGVERRR